jgi:AcrR family transcriptional regulator
LTRPKLLNRPERRRALLAAAARAFARGGFAATSLAEVAAEAGVSRVLIYRHFDSKEQLYRTVLEQTRDDLMRATGGPDKLEPSSLTALVEFARQHPDEFQLFFRHAGREPDFRAHADWLRVAMTETTQQYLREVLADHRLRAWASELVPSVVIETILAWIEAGFPQHDRAADTIAAVISGVIEAIGQAGRPDGS